MEQLRHMDFRKRQSKKCHPPCVSTVETDDYLQMVFRFTDSKTFLLSGEERVTMM